MKRFALCSFFATVLAACDAAVSDLQITEFLASSDNGITDFEGDTPDWVEIYNSGGTTVSLEGLYLSDDATDPQLWPFPASTTLAAGAYQIVFCSGKDPPASESELHASFRLSAGGEDLVLTDGANQIDGYTPYPAQDTDISYGIDSNGDIGFFLSPTPGLANGVRDTIVEATPVEFSVERGFYGSPFNLVLSTSSGVDIRYTVDGSAPDASTSPLYTGPIAITTTTVVRAAATNALDDVETHSYIFLSDVLQQPAAIDGFPNGVPRNVAEPGNFFNPRPPVPFDTEMDPTIVNNNPTLEALQAIPTMALTSSLDDLFGPDGVYISETEEERPISVEVLDAAHSHYEQIDSGVENHSHNFQKRSLRLNFRGRYGNREWNTPFFRNNDVLSSSTVSNIHRTLIIRSGNNRSWARDSNPDQTCYLLDQMVRDTQIAMSGAGSHGVFVHLYINGAYWGVYNVVERPDDEFMSTYFGGSDDLWHYTNHGLAGDKDATRWNYLTDVLTTRNMGVAENYAEMQEYLDVEQFADYILLHCYYGITDWPGNNFYLGNRNGDDPTPTRFFAWDAELAMDIKHRVNLPPGAHVLPQFRHHGCGIFNIRCAPFLQWFWNIFGSIRRWFRLLLEDEDEDLDIIFIWEALLRSDDFLRMWEERVDLHMAGILSDSEQLARWDALTAATETAMIGETARWGDSLELLGYPTRTIEGDWRPQVQVIRNLIQGNQERLLTALRNANLYGARR